MIVTCEVGKSNSRPPKLDIISKINVHVNSWEYPDRWTAKVEASRIAYLLALPTCAVIMYCRVVEVTE